MWHTALLVLLLMLCSATLASWKFGGEEPEFATTSRALQTQFMMMIGEFPEHWTHTAHMTTYVVRRHVNTIEQQSVGAGGDGVALGIWRMPHSLYSHPNPWGSECVPWCVRFLP